MRRNVATMGGVGVGVDVSVAIVVNRVAVLALISSLVFCQLQLKTHGHLANDDDEGVSCSSSLHYRLVYDPTVNLNTIFITIEVPPRLNVTLPTVYSIARGVPSDYSEQPYDSFVQNITAMSSSSTIMLPVVKDEYGPRWVINSTTTTDATMLLSNISYSIDLLTMETQLLSSGDSSKIRPDRFLGVLGISVFGYLDSFEDNTICVSYEVPPNWPCYSTLTPSTTSVGSITSFAGNYYELQDSQFAAGPDINVLAYPMTNQVNLYLMVYAEGDVDLDLMGSLAAKAMDSVVSFWGSPAFDNYTVWVELLEPISSQQQYGFGLEHLQSATFCLEASDTLLSNSSSTQIQTMLYFFAHHITHAWIPKRCYFEYYYPFQFEIAPVMDSIWFNEGWGQYLAILAIAPTFGNASSYIEYKVNSRFQSTLEGMPSFLLNMPLQYLSQIGSTQYALDFRTGETIFSRGGLMARAIDLYIQSQTNSEYSIQQPVNALYAWSIQQSQPLTIDVVTSIFRNTTGVDISSIITDWLGPYVPQQ
eukprot:TRINITY_DN291_c0_g4_i1.p2 TRINITY_DN291_c0_g4~~TRINITY_DN291_c0_g4_i1.p2  ORF type:complete len:532 (-),score=91.80 TRINITY_DN291_c0_g4_i1:112-1707(-)